MPLFCAIFSIFSLQIALCLFGYYENEKLKSDRSFNIGDHPEIMGTVH